MNNKTSLKQSNKIICPICNNLAKLKFDINGEKSSRKYYECSSCHFLFQNKHSENEAIYKKMDWQKEDPGFVKRNEMIKKIIKENIKDKNKTILDYGCGKGNLVDSLKNDNYEVYGFDPFMLEEDKTRNIYKEKEKIPLKNFDYLVAVETIEHLNNPINDLRNILKLLKDNGTFIFTTQIYNPKIHNEKWQYLSLAHMSIYSLKSLEILAKKFKFTKRIPIKEQFYPHNEYLIGQIWNNNQVLPFNWSFDNIKLKKLIKY